MSLLKIPQLIRLYKHAITFQAWDKDGNPTAATIFGAFAAKSVNSSNIHVQLNDDRTGLPETDILASGNS